MRFALVRDPRDPKSSRVGVVRDEAVHLLRDATTIVELLGDDGETLRTAAERAIADPAAVHPLANVGLLPPVPAPPSLRDFYAFEQHVRTARERRGLTMEPDWYELPVFYFSNPRGVVGPGVDVAVPPGCTELDYE